MLAALTVLFVVKYTEMNNQYICNEVDSVFCDNVRANEIKNKEYIELKTKEWNCDLGIEKCSEK